MSKCIKCGRELTSGEIPEFNYGMCDKCYKDYQCKQYPFKKGIYDMQEEIKQLKQQLVEKEKELAYMTKQAKKFNNEAQKYYEDAYCNSFQNQKAIAELERLKEEFNGAFSFSTQQEMFDKYIDQQIAELKGETNE